VATDQSVLTRQAVVRVDRDADWVFRELHDPRALIRCVPGGHITRIIDARTFEASVVAGVGPFKITYAGIGHIKKSDPGSRTASLTIAGAGLGMPPSRVRMSMVVWAVGPGARLEMSFRVALGCNLLSRELIDLMVGDLLDRTLQRIKLQLESRSLQTAGTAP
jgi:carbon monoxide dehydrogenase subunit G